MADHAGRLRLGTDRGRLVLLTTRDGLAAQAGHDLTIEITRWSGELEVADDLSPAGLRIQADMNSLAVREGTGGIKPLTDRDRREIAVTARRLLGAERQPEATYTASGFEPAEGGGGIVHGTLSLNGASKPLKMTVRRTGQAAYRATGTVRQSDFGIKPYTAFLGVLKVSDPVSIVVDVELPDGSPAGLAGAGGPS
jgi:polyisoprenoid-binding protein YceI